MSVAKAIAALVRLGAQEFTLAVETARDIRAEMRAPTGFAARPSLPGTAPAASGTRNGRKRKRRGVKELLKDYEYVAQRLKEGKELPGPVADDVMSLALALNAGGAALAPVPAGSEAEVLGKVAAVAEAQGGNGTDKPKGSSKKKGGGAAKKKGSPRATATS